MYVNQRLSHLPEMRVHYVSASSVRFVAKRELLQLKSGSGPIWYVNISQKSCCASVLSGVADTLTHSIKTSNQGRMNLLGNIANLFTYPQLFEKRNKSAWFPPDARKNLLSGSKSIFNKRVCWIILRDRSNSLFNLQFQWHLNPEVDSVSVPIPHRKILHLIYSYLYIF